MTATRVEDHSKTLSAILTEAQIAALVNGYAAEPAWLASVPTQKCNGLYPAGANAFNGFMDSLFTHFDAKGEVVRPTTGISGADRERCIITILASGQANAELAIHFYWGICEGLSVEALCQILLVTGSYSGYRSYVNSLGLLQRSLEALGTLFSKDATEHAPVKPRDALQAILKVFPLS